MGALSGYTSACECITPAAPASITTLQISLILSGSPKPFSVSLQPCCASAVAIPRPIPEVEPVTSACLPFRVNYPSQSCSTHLAARKNSPAAMT
jgi:hypothetical protein